MEFLKERCYSSLNADELRVGDKVIVAYNLYGLKEQVKMFTESAIDVIEVIQDEDYFNRFKVKHGDGYPLAYLVERAENCTNCVHREGERCKPNVSPINCCPCYDREVKQSYIKPKTEEKWCKNCSVETCSRAGVDVKVRCPAWQPKAEKHYRPFKDTDELVKVWQRKCGDVAVRLHKLDAPYIWVRYKAHPENNYLITGLFGENDEVFIGQYSYKLSEFFRDWEFLDGSPCGVEE